MVNVLKRRIASLSVTFLWVAAALVLLAGSASAASWGASSACTFTSATRAQCNFPIISTTFNSEAHYLTVQCSSTGIAFNLKQVEILAIPPNGAADLAYQVGGNRGSVGGVANLGAIIDVYVRINTSSAVLIDFAPAPTLTTGCTASLTATY